jgi:hypothetical protein
MNIEHVAAGRNADNAEYSPQGKRLPEYQIGKDDQKERGKGKKRQSEAQRGYAQGLDIKHHRKNFKRQSYAKGDEEFPVKDRDIDKEKTRQEKRKTEDEPQPGSVILVYL